MAKVTDDRSYHPIREFIENLPEWDKVPRVDTLLIDYLGADDNENASRSISLRKSKK